MVIHSKEMAILVSLYKNRKGKCETKIIMKSKSAMEIPYKNYPVTNNAYWIDIDCLIFVIWSRQWKRKGNVMNWLLLVQEGFQRKGGISVFLAAAFICGVRAGTGLLALPNALAQAGNFSTTCFMWKKYLNCCKFEKASNMCRKKQIKSRQIKNRNWIKTKQVKKIGKDHLK